MVVHDVYRTTLRLLFCSGFLQRFHLQYGNTDFLKHGTTVDKPRST
ncbi:Uncharacterised protein [Klebsiella pneumoniae]|nr:Uncharacterised protein [Klebsiella pneumoniae]